jgi:hypothetical protein
MAKVPSRTICFISSFPPRQCRIANFTSDLIKAIRVKRDEEFTPLVVTMRASEEVEYSDPVALQIRQNVEGDYRAAADSGRSCRKREMIASLSGGVEGVVFA